MLTLYIVVPCYNEEEVLPETSKRLKEKFKFLTIKKKISENSKILFVDDCSQDNTWNLINSLVTENNIFQGLKLAKNKGHQFALLAGLLTAKEYCDAAISMDSDLQDDINAIDSFLNKYDEGCDIVYGVRTLRKKDTIFKKYTALAFYKLMKLLGVDIIYNHADYRLMSKRAICALEQFSEVNIFLRGMIPLLGYKTGIIHYERLERFAGESKYPLRKMLSFAFEGVSSLSIKPIRLITIIGFLIFISSIVMLIFLVFVYFSGKAVIGWPTITISIWILGGFQILAIGIIGEYIGKIYLESKHRPKFIIEQYLKRE
jgi:glycosyltransferase involved in cell wall biosynthesis